MMYYREGILNTFLAPLERDHREYSKCVNTAPTSQGENVTGWKYKHEGLRQRKKEWSKRRV